MMHRCTLLHAAHFSQDRAGDPSKFSGIGVIFGSDKMELVGLWRCQGEKNNVPPSHHPLISTDGSLCLAPTSGFAPWPASREGERMERVYQIV